MNDLDTIPVTDLEGFDNITSTRGHQVSLYSAELPITSLRTFYVGDA